MTDLPERRYDIDPNRMVDLDRGWRAAVCLGEDGAETFWLVSPQPEAEAGCGCVACAPHEQTVGPLVYPPRTRRSRGATGTEAEAT